MAGGAKVAWSAWLEAAPGTRSNAVAGVLRQKLTCGGSGARSALVIRLTEAAPRGGMTRDR
jgi:hypothetical protein